MAAQSRSERLLTSVKRLLSSLAALVAAAALSAFVLLALLALFDPFDDAPHPSDATMLERFQRQRQALQELVGMIDDDAQLERLAPDFTRPDPAPVSAARVADYRRRLEAAGVRHGFSHYGDKVTFIVSARGLSIAGSAKSFVQATAPDPDAHLVDGDLDTAFAALPDKDALLQRPIAEGWWLELDAR